MTSDAARFLLLPTPTQIWHIVHAYMELAERGAPGTRLVTVYFLMRLGLLELCRPYRVDDPVLIAGQRAILADMAMLGITYCPPCKGRPLYYSTPLAQHLFGGAAAGSSNDAEVEVVEAEVPCEVLPRTSTACAGAVGSLVLETNFRLYAYTNIDLWTQVLSLFARVRGGESNL